MEGTADRSILLFATRLSRALSKSWFDGKCCPALPSSSHPIPSQPSPSQHNNPIPTIAKRGKRPRGLRKGTLTRSVPPFALTERNGLTLTRHKARLSAPQKLVWNKKD